MLTQESRELKLVIMQRRMGLPELQSISQQHVDGLRDQLKPMHSPNLYSANMIKCWIRQN